MTVFLSTPSVGRATRPVLTHQGGKEISIHALRGEGDRAAAGLARNALNFYPRPPWGGRPVADGVRAEYDEFLSTPSVGRATFLRLLVRALGKISIHALRGEGDPKVIQSTTGGLYFYPRPPWGGRRTTWVSPEPQQKFLSTPSVGRATQERCAQKRQYLISIHALRGEGDPDGGIEFAWYIISIHALRGEGDPAAV